MEYNPDRKEQLPATLVDHPQVPLLLKLLGLNQRPVRLYCRWSPLEALQPLPLRLVTLKMARLVPAEILRVHIFQSSVAI